MLTMARIAFNLLARGLKSADAALLRWNRWGTNANIHSYDLILSGTKDLFFLTLLEQIKKQILRRCAPQDDIIRKLRTKI